MTMSEVTLKFWIVCSFILALKMWANSAIQAYARFKYKTFVNPEDAKAFGAMLKTEMLVQPVEHPLVQRAAFCWRNDLENIPLFMILSLGYALIGGNEIWASVYFSVFVFARVLHTIFYISMAQPWRTLAYELGAFATLVMAIHALYLALC
jgi:uncharacterized membrane protein YecN with MAPEG domain